MDTAACDFYDDEKYVNKKFTPPNNALIKDSQMAVNAHKTYGQLKKDEFLEEYHRQMMESRERIKREFEAKKQAALNGIKYVPEEVKEVERLRPIEDVAIGDIILLDNGTFNESSIFAEVTRMRNGNVSLRQFMDFGRKRLICKNLKREEVLSNFRHITKEERKMLSGIK